MRFLTPELEIVKSARRRILSMNERAHDGMKPNGILRDSLDDVASGYDSYCAEHVFQTGWRTQHHAVGSRLFTEPVALVHNLENHMKKCRNSDSAPKDYDIIHESLGHVRFDPRGMKAVVGSGSLPGVRPWKDHTIKSLEHHILPDANYGDAVFAISIPCARILTGASGLARYQPSTHVNLEGDLNKRKSNQTKISHSS